MPRKDKDKHKQWMKEYWASHPKPKNCVYCGTVYDVGRDYRVRKYCGRVCASRASGEKQRKYLNIPDCLKRADRKLDKNLGYVRIYAPMHPKANSWGYVYEHRLVAEEVVGRKLESNEVVHHKNGKRWDNRPENLEVMDKADHSRLKGQRPEDMGLRPIGEASLL